MMESNGIQDEDKEDQVRSLILFLLIYGGLVGMISALVYLGIRAFS